MASITLQVIINDLDNTQLDGFDEKFERWFRNAYKSSDAPDGVLEEVSEIDREEDENGEET